MTKKETKKQALKGLRSDISRKLEEALTDLKKGLGEKKFRKRVKKASALFSNGLPVRQKATKAADHSPKKKEKKQEKTEEVA